MRATPAETKPATQATNGEGQSADVATLLTAMLDRISAERAACEKLGDPELAQRAGRKMLTAVACAADAILADAKTLHSAPDKVGAFFDKSATACVAAIEGLHKRAVLADPAAANQLAQAQPRAADPLANSYVAWGSPAPPLRRE
jgi:hypothetical protein